MPAYLVRRDEFFDRARLYGSRQEEYNDNRERFIFFSRSIPVLCEALGFIPDVILGNDWQTGLVMALLAQGIFPQTAGVFAIHNLGYLGLVLLAAGEVSYQQLFAELQAQQPSRFGLRLGFDPVLSHKIFAGCECSSCHRFTSPVA